MVFAYAFGLVFVIVFAAARSQAYFFPDIDAGNTPPAGTNPSKPANIQPRETVDLDRIEPAAYVDAADHINNGGISAFKRSVDIALSLSALLFLAPLLALVAAAIKLETPGPVIYRQKRVGFQGRLFEVYKFRSMIAEAEDDGPRYADPEDERITGLGRIIRKFRIDEIPQTINVLRGDMSFIGPRPERPEFVDELAREIPHYHCRHLIKPGITGWAQVKYEYAASVEGARNKLRYDLFYISRFSPLMDLAIIAMTARVALFGLGGR